MSKPNTERADWDVTDIPELLAEIESLRAENVDMAERLHHSIPFHIVPEDEREWDAVVQTLRNRTEGAS